MGRRSKSTQHDERTDRGGEVPAAMDAGPAAKGPSRLGRRHRVCGWLSLWLFLTLGLVLEALHGFKVDWYVDVANESRRFMWTLAHAHGTLLGLLNLALAYHLDRWSRSDAGGPVPPFAGISSAALVGATVLLPLGFFLGGVVIHSGDPGKGVLLVPIGALLLIMSVGLTALAEIRSKGS